MRKCISVMLSLFLIFGILSGVEVKNVKAENEGRAGEYRKD